MFGSRLLSFFSPAILALMLMPVTAAASPTAVTPLDSRPGSLQPDVIRSPAAPHISRARFPILFVANQGQWAPEILFTAQAGAARFLFMAREVVIQVPGATDEPATARLHLSAEAALPAPAAIAPVPGERASTRVNYFQGSNARDWRTDVPTYRSLRYPRVAPGVDLIFRDAEGAIAYDLVVAPGADPAGVKLALSGVETLALDDGGAMIMTLSPDIRLRQQAPFIYQEQAGERVAVNGGFIIDDTRTETERHSFGFQVAAYDPALPLVIDPTVTYSSFVGSALNDETRALAVTEDGEVIVVGSTWSSNFPGTPTVFGSQSRKDALIYRIAADGSALDYVTILAGSADEQVNAVILDEDGSLYLTGQTTSANFPMTNPLFPLLGGIQDAFIAKLSAEGNLLRFSTYFGGSRVDTGRALGLDADGYLYVAGTTNSTDLFTQQALYPNPLGGDDGFVVKLTIDDTQGATLVTSTYFGGGMLDSTNGNDSIEALAVTPVGDLYLGGTTAAKDLPVLHPMQETLAGGTDVWVARIVMQGPELAFCTYLGGLKNEALSTLSLDGDGHVLLTGLTDSLDFPVVNALYSTSKGYNDAFVAKLDASGRFLHFATYFGGNWDDRALAATLDQAADATDGLRHLYVAGSTTSTLLPTVDPDQRWNAGVQDGWLARFDPRGLNVSYASYFGGTASDSLVALGSQPTTGSGAVFLAGSTASNVSGHFPQGINTPFQADNAGGIDTFVAHIEDMDSQSLSDTNATPRFALDFLDKIPERDGAEASFTLSIVDPTPVGISAFSTKVHYDIDTLEFVDLAWDDGLPDTAVPDVDHSKPGILRLTLYQNSATPTALDGTMATLNFEVRDVGSPTTPPKPSKQSILTLQESWAADLNGRNAYIDGTSGTGGILIQRRCNNLIGDCDCSGQVRIWEVQSGVMNFLDTTNTDPICVKRDYTTMTATDLTEIINNHLDQVIETSAIDGSAKAQEEQDENAAIDRTAARLKLTRLPDRKDKVRAGLVLNTGGENISLLTTDIRYDPRIFSSVRPVVGAAAKKASKQMVFRVVKPGWLRIMIYGLNRNTLSKGTIATLHLVPKVDLSRHPTRLTHRPQASSPNARHIRIGATHLELP